MDIKDLLIYTTFFIAVTAFTINILFSTVYADHEATIPDPNTNIDFFIEKILPACDFFKNIGLKPIDADCSEWYMTHQGNKLVVDYLMK